MSWTDERVERLSRLWLEGLSASQIAADLGEGVSRNAVIGKVHRLGLSGRSTSPSSEAAIVEIEMQAEPAFVADSSTAAMDVGQIDEEEDLPIDLPIEIEAAPVPLAIDLSALRPRDAALPQPGRVTMLELGATMCRWPLGDPTSAEFRFCGCRATSGLPYCPEHARVAFQPVNDRRRVERMVRMA